MHWRLFSGVLGHVAQAPSTAASHATSSGKTYSTNKSERPTHQSEPKQRPAGEPSNVSITHVDRNSSVQGTPLSFMGESRTDNSIMGCSLLSSRSIMDNNTFELPGSSLTMEWHAQRSFHEPNGMSHHSVGVSLHDPYSVHGPPSVTIGSIAASVGGSGVWANSVASIHDPSTSAHQLYSKPSMSQDSAAPQDLYDAVPSRKASLPATSLYATQRGGRVGDDSERRSLFDDMHINELLPVQPYNPSQQTQHAVRQEARVESKSVSHTHQEATVVIDLSKHHSESGNAVTSSSDSLLKPTLSSQLRSIQQQPHSQSRDSAHSKSNQQTSDNSRHANLRPLSTLHAFATSRSKSAHGGLHGQLHHDSSNHSHSGHWPRSRQRLGHHYDRSVGHPVRIGASIAEGNDGEEHSSNGKLATRLSSSEPSHHMNSSRGIPDDLHDLNDVHEDLDTTTSRTLEWLRQYLDVLGQGSDSKQIFVARRHLTLPALGLLSSFLSYTPAIRVLTLVHAGLDDAGATELAIGLRQSYGGLWVLDLRNNSIGDQGAAALASCLPCCPELKDIVLSYNNIGDDGVHSLVDEVSAAGQRQSPVRIRLSHNPASQDAVKALANACRNTKTRRLRASRSMPSMYRHIEDPTGHAHGEDLDKSPDADILLDGTNTSEEDDRARQPVTHGNSRFDNGHAVQNSTDHMSAALFNGEASVFDPGQGMSRRQQAAQAERQELERLCELVRVLSTPSMPVEHRVAQDVGAALMKYDMISRQRLGAGVTCSSQPLPMLAASNSFKSLHRIAGSTLDSSDEQQGTLSWAVGEDLSNPVILQRSGSQVVPTDQHSHHDTVTFQSIDVLGGEASNGNHYTVVRGSKDYSSLNRSVDGTLKASDRAVDGELSMLVSALTSRGHQATSAVSGGCPNVADCLQNLRHMYLTVFLPPSELGYGPADAQHAQHDDDASDVACLSTYSYAMTVASQAHHAQHGQSGTYAARTGRSNSASPGDLGSFEMQRRNDAREESKTPEGTSKDGTPTNSLYANQQSPVKNNGTNNADPAGFSSKGTAQHSTAVATAMRVKSHTVHGGCEFYNSSTLVEGKLSDVADTFAAASSQVRNNKNKNNHNNYTGKQSSAGSAHLQSRASMPHTVNTGYGLATPWLRGNRVIVDPKFRDQFELGKYTTQRYDAIVSMLPRVFVGHEDRLPLLVEMLCEEMSSVFKDRGRPVPPWRKASSLISKWKQRGVAGSGQLPDSSLSIRQ